MQLSDIDYLPLVQYIVKNDEKNIAKFCTDFIDQLLYVPMPAPNYVYSTCYALFNLIEHEFSNYSHDEIRRNTSPKQLYTFTSLDKIKSWLIQSFVELSQFIDAVYGYGDKDRQSDAKKYALEAGDPIIDTARDYIHKNVTNNLKIEDIARHVNLSPSYFAIYFKNKTNINLRDYILKEKMSYARLQLIKPDISVTDLAFQIGYHDYRSFSRAFKNVHGMTPSDYRDAHMKE